MGGHSGLFFELFCTGGARSAHFNDPFGMLTRLSRVLHVARTFESGVNQGPGARLSAPRLGVFDRDSMPSSGLAGSASPGARPAAARRAASTDRGRQPFPCLLQPALECTRRPAKLMSGLISGETFQVAQHERDAELVREPNQLPVQNLVRFPQGDLSEEGGSYAYWTSR